MLKVYFLSSEIAPFSETYSLSKFSREFSITLNNDKDIDIRLAQPKYGYISDRRYILREVIRLKEMEINFNNRIDYINIKSGFIPNSRVQVYFTEHSDYFSNVPELIYKSRNGRIYINNVEKYLLFSIGALKTLEKLFWIPDVIVCNDWQIGLLPLIFNNYYKSIFKNTKIVFIGHSYNKNYICSKKNIKELNLPINSKAKDFDILDYSINESNISYILDKQSGPLINRISKDKKIKKNKYEIFEYCSSTDQEQRIDIYNKIANNLKKL